MNISSKLIARIRNGLKTIPKVWDGKNAILAMKNADYPQWRQMEWIGFYFEFLCKTHMAGILEVPGPSFGRVTFDGFAEIPWDFKAHPRCNAKGEESPNLVTNDWVATRAAIKKFGAAGIIAVVGDATFNDEDRNFQLWHKKLKGGLSPYEKERIKRRAVSRLRKTAFTVTEILLIKLEGGTIRRMSSFQEGFRNSDGSPRKSKVMLNLPKLGPADIIARIQF